MLRTSVMLAAVAVSSCSPSQPPSNAGQAELAMSVDVLVRDSGFFAKVVLANASHDRQVEVNSKMEWGLEPNSELSVKVFDQIGRPIDPGACFTEGRDQQADYVLLKPHQRITTLVPLICFELKSLDSASLEVTYTGHGRMSSSTKADGIHAPSKVTSERIWFKPKQMLQGAGPANVNP